MLLLIIVLVFLVLAVVGSALLFNWVCFGDSESYKGPFPRRDKGGK